MTIYCCVFKFLRHSVEEAFNMILVGKEHDVRYLIRN